MDVVTHGLLSKLKKKIEDMESVSDDKIVNAVNIYLDENPVQLVDIATVDEINSYLEIS